MNEVQKGIVVQDVEAIRHEQWYESLLDDILAIKVERETEAREIVLQSKWEIGQRITEENARMERKEIYGQRIIENLSQDIGRSTTDLWNCVKFYKEFPEENFTEVMGKLPGGKEMSWYKVTTTVLGERKNLPPKEKTTFKIDDIMQALREFIVAQGVEKNSEIEKALADFKELLLK